MPPRQTLPTTAFLIAVGIFAIFATLSAVAADENPQGASLRIVNPDGAWMRIEVRDGAGKMYQPAAGSIQDRTASNRPETKPYYKGHFVARGEAVVAVPPGEYTVLAERGLEYTRVRKQVHARAGAETRVEAAPRRWIEMARRGWWSADFHVHRPIEDVPALVQAEDLNLAVVFTMWNRRNLWEGRQTPADPVLRADSTHVASVMNAEDERGGGAWMLHNLKRPLALGVEGRWFPQGRIFVEQLRSQREAGGLPVWFDMEKPFWWEVPVMMALDPPDSFGVINNHFDQYGIHSGEAWGRPRDQKVHPGAEGFVAYCLGLYYRYLNLGFKLPASAGGASGVLPNPVGQNRVYADLRGAAFDVAAYYEAVRRGRTFVTNGPMLWMRVNGRPPGDSISAAGGAALTIELEALAREPIERIELVANGTVVGTWKAGGATRWKKKLAWKPDKHTWVAARCVLAPGDTILLAHTSPVYLSGAAWDARADAQYFVRWIDEMIARPEGENYRFGSQAERSEVMAIYRRAREFYEQRTR